MSVDLVIDAVSWVLIVAGSIFLIIGAVGLVRMPDVFTRMHAISVSDTAGAGLLLIAMMLQAGFSLVTAKLLFILAIFFFTGPVATHALSRAALSVGIRPLCFDPSGRTRRNVPLDLADSGGASSKEKAAPKRKPAAKTRTATAKKAKSGNTTRSGSSRGTAGTAKPRSKPRGGGSSKR